MVKDYPHEKSLDMEDDDEVPVRGGLLDGGGWGVAVTKHVKGWQVNGGTGAGYSTGNAVHARRGGAGGARALGVPSMPWRPFLSPPLCLARLTEEAPALSGFLPPPPPTLPGCAS